MMVSHRDLTRNRMKVEVPPEVLPYENVGHLCPAEKLIPIALLGCSYFSALLLRRLPQTDD